MKPDHDPVAERLAALFQEYRNQLPDRMRQIESQFVLLRDDPADRQRISDLLFSLHKLAGSGTTFGFEDITRISRRWERMLQPRIKDGSAVPLPELDEMTSILNELRSAIDSTRESDL
jgi:chemotaxis protein histidine kinase CheA